jgi:hypothetical protein
MRFLTNPLLPRIASVTTASANWIVQWRLQVLFCFLFVQVVAFCTQGLWVEDFWEHSAAVNEFMQRPLKPTHPQLDIVAPHPFLNPYTFLVALFANLLNTDAVSALAIFGVFNFCLFFFGLRVFIGSLLIPAKTTNRSFVDHAVFYALLFILFFWGAKPWTYSGFFNYQSFFFNLPYPSTFVAGLSLLGLGIIAHDRYRHPYLQLVALILITSFSLLSHPLTTQFLLLGFVAQAFGLQSRTLGVAVSKNIYFVHFIKIALIFICAVALASLWPFYPILELFKGAGKVYNISNGDMYFHLSSRLWPFIWFSPVILWVLLRPQARTLLVIFVLTTGIYISGYLSQHYSFGRIISYSILSIQIACALAACQTEVWLQIKFSRPVKLVKPFVVGLIVFLCVSQLVHGSISRLLTVANSIRLGRTISNQLSYKNYLFLPNIIEHGAIVFASIKPSWLLPTFGAKVIAADHPLAFVKDAEQRRQDITDFFEQNISAEQRSGLLQKYRARYLLLDKTADAAWKQIQVQFSQLPKNSVIFENENFLMIQFDPAVSK